MTVVNVLTFVKDLIGDDEKMGKFKEIIADIKELIADIKDILVFFKK